MALSLLDEIASELQSATEMRKRYGLRGYLVVGSRSLLETMTTNSDSDVVLLASEETNALEDLYLLLCPKDDKDDRRVWLVTTAIVSILKVERNTESLDLLWLGGCTFSQNDDDAFVAFDVDETDHRYTLPPDESLGPEGDSILLTRLFRKALFSEEMSFDVPMLTVVRQWAKARHLYGSRYG